jgi:hypothetical protein
MSCRWGRLQQSWWRSWTGKRKVLVLVPALALVLVLVLVLVLALVLVLVLVLVLALALALPVLAAGGLAQACRHPSRWRKWRRPSWVGPPLRHPASCWW